MLLVHKSSLQTSLPRAVWQWLANAATQLQQHPITLWATPDAFHDAFRDACCAELRGGPPGGPPCLRVAVRAPEWLRMAESG